MSAGDHRICMIRPTLEGLPDYALPASFALRAYASGDESAWLAIHEQADPYHEITPALYREQFGEDPVRLRERQFFLVSPEGHPIGTASAWDDVAFRGERWGRVHWVAILPAFQGRGLAKPLMRRVCLRLRELGHDKAYLTTATYRVAAIGLYRHFGFQPDIQDDGDARKWASIGIIPSTAG